MNHGDPTDHALAAIASILDRPAESPDDRPAELSNNSAEDVEALADQHPDEPVATPTERSQDTDTDFSDPDAVDSPDTVPETNASPAPFFQMLPDSNQVTEVDVASYMRAGPGPLDAIRFRWSARCDDSGAYYVDETIGPNSQPVSTGPMPRDQVVAYIDAQEAEAVRRFTELKNEMRLRVPLLRNLDDSGD